MDLLAVAVLCGPLVAPETTLRVIRVESAGQVYAIHDDSDGRYYAPTSVADAMGTAAALMRASHRLDLGLMQINYEVWLRAAQVRLDQVFDPCMNVRFGTTILSAAYARALDHSRSATEALTRALSAYHSGDESHAIRYAQKVLATGMVSQRNGAPTSAHGVHSR